MFLAELEVGYVITSDIRRDTMIKRENDISSSGIVNII